MKKSIVMGCNSTSSPFYKHDDHDDHDDKGETQLLLLVDHKFENVEGNRISLLDRRIIRYGGFMASSKMIRPCESLRYARCNRGYV